MKKIRQLIFVLWEDQDFFRKMLVIAIPLALQNFITSFLNMVDTIMVGKLGETEIAAVGIANQYFFIFTMLLIGISAGSSVLIAQFWGKKDLESIKRMIGIGLTTTLLIAVGFVVCGLFFPRGIMVLFNNDPGVVSLGIAYLRIVLVSYIFVAITFVYSFSLRSIGNVLHPMLISAGALLVNVFLNYLLIFGKCGMPVMGVRGAALATVIARFVETVALLLFIYGGKNILAASFRELIVQTVPFIKKAYQTILPVVLDYFCWGLGGLVYVAVYGRMGTQAVVTIQICNTINNLFLVVVFGLSSAAAVLVGNSVGAQDEAKGKDYACKFSVFSVLLGLGLGFFLVLSSPFLLNFFKISIVVRHAAQIIIWLSAAIFSIRVLNIVLIVGVLQGGGDVKRAFLIEVSTMWLIGVPLTIIGAFVFQFPVYIVYALALAEEICKGVLCLQRLKTGLWIRDVTQDMVVSR